MILPNMRLLTIDWSTISAVIAWSCLCRSSRPAAMLDGALGVGGGSEIGAAHRLVGEQILVLTFCARLALLQHVGAVAHVEGQSGILLDHDHGGFRGADFPDLVEDQVYDDG